MKSAMSSSSMPPLPESTRTLVYNESKGYGAPIWFESQMRAYGEACAAAEREAFRALVSNDSAAITYQTLWQYRTALLTAIRARGET